MKVLMSMRIKTFANECVATARSKGGWCNTKMKSESYIIVHLTQAEKHQECQVIHVSSTTRCVMNGVISMQTQLSSGGALVRRRLRDRFDLRLPEGDVGLLGETGLVESELLLCVGDERPLGRRFFKRRRGLLGGVARSNTGWSLSAIHNGCGIWF